MGETIMAPTNPIAQTPEKLVFSDIKEIAISDIDSIKELHYKIMTEQHGIAEGETIAEGRIDVK